MATGMIFWPIKISIHHSSPSSQMYPVLSFHPLYHHNVPSFLPRGHCRLKPLSPNKKGTGRDRAYSVSSVCICRWSSAGRKGLICWDALVVKVPCSLTKPGGPEVCRPGVGTRSAARSVCWVKRLEKTGHSVKMNLALVPITPFQARLLPNLPGQDLMKLPT